MAYITAAGPVRTLYNHASVTFSCLDDNTISVLGRACHGINRRTSHLISHITVTTKTSCHHETKCSKRTHYPGRILLDFLVTLGIKPVRIPQNVDARSALYRAALKDRRVLVLLDNAASYEQVEPLMPASPRSMTIVTSRLHLQPSL